MKLIADGVKNETAEKISSWYLANWGLIFGTENNATVIPNTGIKSFKVYRDPVSFSLIGEIGLKNFKFLSL